APAHVLSTRNREAAHDASLGKHGLEDLSLCLLQMTAEVGDHELETQVWFVGAVSKQRVLHVHSGKWGDQIDIEDLFPDPRPQTFDQREDVFLVAEGHLEVELRELERAIRAQVLITQAAS